MSSAAWPDANHPTGVLNWRRIDARLTTSGQPNEAQLTALRDLGVEVVINLALHTHERALPDEAASVAALGMRYVHIPVAFDDPREDDHRRFVAALAEAEGEQVHVHCILNARVSAFLFRHRVETGAATPEQARAEMESVWRPGGVWARFIGDPAREGEPHLYAGRDY